MFRLWPKLFKICQCGRPETADPLADLNPTACKKKWLWSPGKCAFKWLCNWKVSGPDLLNIDHQLLHCSSLLKRSAQKVNMASDCRYTFLGVAWKHSVLNHPSSSCLTGASRLHAFHTSAVNMPYWLQKERRMLLIEKGRQSRRRPCATLHFGVKW